MKKEICARVLTGIVSFALLFMAIATSAHARQKIDTDGKFRLEVAGGFGIGLNDAFLGTIVGTTRQVEISAGGGLKGEATAGYGLSSHFDIDLTAGYQRASISEEVINGNASFARKYVLGTVKFKIPLKHKGDLYSGQIKLGLGLGFYFGGKLDHEYTPLTGGPTNYLDVEYDRALGYHASAELEAFLAKKWSVVFGTRFTVVSYDADTLIFNGVYYSPASLPGDLQDFDGDSIDFYVGIGHYF